MCSLADVENDFSALRLLTPDRPLSLLVTCILHAPIIEDQ
jgi:hypothetical protein